VRALAIVDGEHYPSVVRDALAELAHDLLAAIEQYEPEVVIDLSDEPVLGPVERFALASRVLFRGLAYEGADFRFDPPERRPFELPSIAVVGTGKRVGKTAVTTPRPIISRQPPSSASRRSGAGAVAEVSRAA
jgi:cyclic 2,3-diphosphoglycerate synthetase